MTIRSSKQKSRFILWGRWFHRDRVVRTTSLACLGHLWHHLLSSTHMAQNSLNPTNNIPDSLTLAHARHR